VISAGSLRILPEPPAISHPDGRAQWITTNASHLFVADETFGVRMMAADNGTLGEVGALPMLQGPYYATATAQAVYVANQSGVWKVDVSDPTNPGPETLVPVSSGTIAMSVIDNHMYMVKGPAPFTEVDLDLIDATRGIDMSGLYVTRLAIIGNHIYSTSRTGMLNVIDRTRMALINRVSATGALQGIAIMEVESDLIPQAYAFVASANGDDGPGIYIFDLQNRLIPSLVGFVRTSGDAYDVAIAGDVLYVTEDTDGLEMFDISDLDNIRAFGAFVSPNGVAGVSVFAGQVVSAVREDGVIYLPVDGCLDN
jgi:hypothetical protein